MLFSDDSTWQKHSGSRDLHSLVEFVVDNGIFGVIQLAEDNFEAVISEGLVFVFYYTSWCSHCKKGLSIWEDFSGSAKFLATLAKVQ